MDFDSIRIFFIFFFIGMAIATVVLARTSGR